MKATEVATKLGVKEYQVRKSKGAFRFHSSYYWGVTTGAEKLVAFVKEKLPEAVIVEFGNHFHEFVGGAKSGSAQDSFKWVTFTLPDPPLIMNMEDIKFRKWWNSPVTTRDLMGA